MTEERLVAIEAFFQRYKGTVAMELAAEVRRCWAEFPVYLAEIERLRAALADEKEARIAAVQAHMDFVDRHLEWVQEQSRKADQILAALRPATAATEDLTDG